MTENEQVAAAKKFSAEWSGIGDEKSDTQHFWTDLVKNIFGVEAPFTLIKFEKPIAEHFIDAVIPLTKVLIEQKSYNVDLTKPHKQSDGEWLTPFEQAKRYRDELDYSERPRWIITCNFQEFRIYDMFDHDSFFATEPVPQIIKLENLNYDFKRLNFLVDPDDDNVKPEVRISKEATELIVKIREAFICNYEKNKQRDYRDSLIKICVRLVFCFYAGDSHIFTDNQFFNYVNSFADAQRNDAIQKLFVVLNQKDRPDNLDPQLANFPYVNGGLFSDKIDLPAFNQHITSPIETAEFLDKTKAFNWHTIHPAIFGALFESVLGKDSRRAGGMHYTSIENIHKVIDPLFLDGLHEDFKRAMRARFENRPKRLMDLQDKLASLKFFDPACGSGNFLTEIYISLRKIENDILRELKQRFKIIRPIKVFISQFYGVEINDYAVAITKLALWIAEHQMHEKTEMITGDAPKLPLSQNDNIHCANALQIDWNAVVDKDSLTYIVGNPPFVGRRYRSREQVADISRFFEYKDVDYVACWYKKAADFIQGTKIRCAFFSTNSITQGEQVTPIWKNLFAQGIHIDFAYRTFKWESESDDVAAVHCVVIGFSQAQNKNSKIIYDGDEIIQAKNINPYLLDAENIFVESRTKPLCNVPEMRFGSMPNDGGNLIIEAEDYAEFIKREPAAKKFIRPFRGAEEFINGKERWCLWLVGISPEEISKMPLVAERVESVRQHRLNSKSPVTRKKAATPLLFYQISQPDSDYILIPSVSSERRKYIPMNFMPAEVIASNLVHIIPDATVYHFGILISSVHMAWTRTVCGRLEMRYRYSKDIVYNNFPFPSPTPEQKAEIESTGTKILDVLAEFLDWTLAKLYDEKTMPEKLRAAHLANDAAVMAAYGFAQDLSEAEIVAELFKRYRSLVSAPPPVLKVDRIFLSKSTTAAEVLQIVRRWKFYSFGVLTSSVHMAWTRTVCGRLKSDYRYSKDIVYNNFPFPSPSIEQKAAIELTAERILNVRALHAGKTLAWLYGAEMPQDLKAAHLANDAAVMKAYGFAQDLSEAEIVARLFERYSALTKTP